MACSKAKLQHLLCNCFGVTRKRYILHHDSIVNNSVSLFGKVIRGRIAEGLFDTVANE
jgi:hypothetical protein